MTEILFDRAFYRAKHGLGVRASLSHYQTQGDALGMDPGPYFSARFYRQRYPDWAAHGAATSAEDYLTRLARGDERQPHPLIDPDWYRAQYADLAGIGCDAALHFILHGDGEMRSPSAGFDAAFYQSCYMPLEARHPFRHYALEGEAKGYLPAPLPRSAKDSRAAMRDAARDHPRPILLCAHNAQPAGVPILTLHLAEHLRGLSYQPIFLLQKAGPLLDRFRSLGPVFITAEGWDIAGLAQGLPTGGRAIINTAAAVDLALPLADAGLQCLLLMHEMPDYLRSQDLLPRLRAAQEAGVQVIASMPAMAAQSEPDLGPIPAIRPGLSLSPVPLSAFRKMHRWRKTQTGPIFIGAGHADYRKGFDLFLSAAEKLQQAQPDACFIWLGALDGWSEQLSATATAKGLRLVLPGFVDDTLAWYRIADAYLLTSRQDAGPATAVHAARMGIPFVAYAADIGIREMADGVGKFVAPDDEPAFVAAALALTAPRSPADRRALRRYVRSQTGFSPYVAALLARFTPDPTAD